MGFYPFIPATAATNVDLVSESGLKLARWLIN
jgi:hypothetical protein